MNAVFELEVTSFRKQVKILLVLHQWANCSTEQPHLNARSLVKNQDALAHLLANINHKFSVLAITETWVKESNVNDLSFEGYNFVSNHRANRIGGGVGLFSNQNFSYKILPKFNVSHANIIESLFVEIFIPRHKNMVI